MQTADASVAELHGATTPPEHSVVLAMFTGSHGGAPVGSLGEPHTAALDQTLHYWGSVRRLGVHAGSPQLSDVCPDCANFKAAMFELQTGILA